MKSFKNNGQFVKGRKPWNYGKVKKFICITCNQEFENKSHGKPKYCSDKCKKNGSWGKVVGTWNKGRPSWNKGKPAPWANWKVLFKPENRKKAIEASKKSNTGRSSPQKGIPLSQETKRKLSLTMTGRKLTKEHIRKSLLKRSMSGLEIKVQKIINKYNLPYKFVGNGAFFIERKNPDFININGEKKAIEVYWKRHKEQIRGINIDEWKKERFEIFARYGWELLFLEASEVNEESLLKALKGGK